MGTVSLARMLNDPKLVRTILTETERLILNSKPTIESVDSRVDKTALILAETINHLEIERHVPADPVRS